MLGFTNAQTRVYLFPGQGSDARLFSKIKLDSSFVLIPIIYTEPEKGASLTSFAKTISKQIDTNGTYCFIGVSMGGMICSELTDYLNPSKVIIISSAKSNTELPFRYRFQKVIPIYKLVPKGLVKEGAQVLQPLVEPDRNANKEVFKSMLASKSSTYYKRTVSMIIEWDRVEKNAKIIQIHGTNDHTIPIRNVQANYTLTGGSHMMTLTRGEELNTLLLELLKN